MTLEELYKDLHAHPELAFAEHRTANIAAGWLDAAGFSVRTGIGGTGVAGVLRNGDGPTVLLRADMDALPVREETGLDYASDVVATDARGERTHVMHACGHDMHVACLCGVADELVRARDDWQGTVIAVFQPAEEIGAGARAMLADGLFDVTGVPDVALGQHVFARTAGTVLHRAGPFLGAAESWDVTLHGRGGHGSRPERTVDPVVMAAAAVLRLQTLVARELAPAERGVVTVSRLRAGHAENVIPDTARFDATIRTFSEEVRDLVARGTVRVCEGIAAAHGLEVDAVYTPQYPVTVNDGPEAAFAGETVTEMFGGDAFVPMANPVTGAEDFSRIIAEVPGAMLFLSAVPPGADYESLPNNHSQYAVFDDGVLGAGAALYAGLALRRLAAEAQASA